jgi:hypothetical protein
MRENRNTEAAFKWIVGLLRKHSIPFQIGGGFAARLYGSGRELADIDIGVNDASLEKLHPHVQEYVTFGPGHYVDKKWDLQLMTLKYEGQEIDIVGRDTLMIFDTLANALVPGHRDLTAHENIEVYGSVVPVISKAALIAYKKKLLREVDRLDVEALERM